MLAHARVKHDSAFDDLPLSLKIKVQQQLDQSVALIRGLRETTRQRVARVLQTAESQQLTAAATADLLEQSVGLLPARAALIARDQTLKLQSTIVETRSKELGSKGYTWDTSNDSRVRPDHRRLNGTFHLWTEPPLVDTRTGRHAHPGYDYSCRCVALPSFDV